jgi:hypothetical protein
MEQPRLRSRVLGPRLRRFLSAVALVGLCTCGIHIHPTADGSAVVPAATVVDQLLGAVAFAGLDKIDLTEQFQNQGVTKDEVSSVVLSSMTLSIQSPQGETFDFLESLSFTAGAPGLPDVEIAHLDTVPKGATSLDLDIDPSVELAPYVVAPSMSITTQAMGSKPSQQTTLAAHVVFDVDANLPGCSH